MELNQKRQEIEIQKKISEKEKINTQIVETRNNQSNLLLQIEKMQESFYSSGAEISKSEQELISLEEKVVLTNNEIESINQKINRGKIDVSITIKNRLTITLSIIKNISMIRI